MSVTLARYGTAVYGTDRYGQQNVAIDAIGVSATGAVGTVSIEAIDTGTNVTVNVIGIKGTAALGFETVTTVVFDFDSVKDNYERRRTVYIHRRNTDLDRTVKVA